MLRALVALLLVSSPASAEEPSLDDPKVGIRDRGIVLKAGKRHFFVVVPPAVPPKDSPAGATLDRAKIYFGDAKSLADFSVISWSGDSAHEERGLADDRNLYDGILSRTGDKYELTCKGNWEGAKSRPIAVKPATSAAVERAVIAPRRTRTAHFFARMPGTTTYVYVDKIDEAEHRLFLGKRGAMTAIRIKEMVSDSSSTVIVTAKGTLTIVPGTSPNDPPVATFGTAKKPTALEPLAPVVNKKLVYFDLGIYTRERSGHPCDEL